MREYIFILGLNKKRRFVFGQLIKWGFKKRAALGSCISMSNDQVQIFNEMHNK